jgi:hypothetical protein
MFIANRPPVEPRRHPYGRSPCFQPSTGERPVLLAKGPAADGWSHFPPPKLEGGRRQQQGAADLV